LLPLVLTLIIETPVLKMISRDSRISSAIGQQHYQLLMGFIPLIAAISGNASAQASSLTTTAICHGQVTSKSYWKWIQEECRVTAVVGLGMGCAVGMLAFTVTSGSTKENLTFALAVGIAQWISLTLAGCTASNFPLLMCLLFRHNSRRMSSLVARALVDVISTTLTCAMSYCILMLFLSQVDAVNSSPDST
jgi:Mg/Co/Ni transporter MgtE